MLLPNGFDSHRLSRPPQRTAINFRASRHFAFDIGTAILAPTNSIPGAHFVGHEGQELINVFGLAIKFGITAHQLEDNVYAYPRFSSDIKHMFGHA